MRPDAATEPVCDEARLYLAALDAQRDHPLVRDHFLQVTRFTWFVATQGTVEFYALEFRVGSAAALVWNDGQGHWGAGDWLPLADAEADLVSPPTPLSLRYFEGRKAHRTFAAALRQLEAARASP